MRWPMPTLGPGPANDSCAARAAPRTVGGRLQTSARLPSLPFWLVARPWWNTCQHRIAYPHAIDSQPTPSPARAAAVMRSCVQSEQSARACRGRLRACAIPPRVRFGVLEVKGLPFSAIPISPQSGFGLLGFPGIVRADTLRRRSWMAVHHSMMAVRLGWLWPWRRLLDSRIALNS